MDSIGFEKIKKTKLGYMKDELFHINKKDNIGDFEFEIGNKFEENEVICKVYFNKKFLALLKQENKIIMLRIQYHNEIEYWRVPLEDFQKTLDLAKKNLLEAINSI